MKDFVHRSFVNGLKMFYLTQSVSPKEFAKFFKLVYSAAEIMLSAPDIFGVACYSNSNIPVY